MVLLTIASFTVHAQDPRNKAVLNSSMVKAIINGLSSEQRLTCKIAIEEDGNESIAYYRENHLSKFSAAFLCNNGESAIITGVIGDGGQTKTESFRLTYAN